MPKIMPVSDLRNYTDVLQNCDVNREVFLTKNGRGRYVLMDIDAYEKQQAKLKLLLALSEGESSVKSDADWIPIEVARQRLGV